MGAHDVRAPAGEADHRAVTRATLADLAAFERMWEEGLFESGVDRVGAEQELFLVDETGRPTCRALELLDVVHDPAFTTELACYNLEINLPATRLDGGFLDRMRDDLQGAMDKGRSAGADLGLELAMVGILPSLERGDLGLEHITPLDRYRAMNDALIDLRGDAFVVYVRGLDVLETTVGNVMLESANTSYQLHLQVSAEDFARKYNLVQAITGPVLAAAVNAPCLLGQRLWQETRIALFERATDGRSAGKRARNEAPRVGFGERWLKHSPLEIFREDVARHRPILMRDPDPDPLATLDRGELPPLRSLALFNGTVWRWNRPCFGVHDGVAHLRIENRVLPSGPTVVDAIANAALFYGVVLGLDGQLDDIRERMSFAAAHRNFLAAARDGLDARFEWLDGRPTDARSLLLEELIPLAWLALSARGVPDTTLERTLGVIRDRVQSGQTGARWLLDNLERLDHLPQSRRFRALTRVMVLRELSGLPVHRWAPVDEAEIAALPPAEIRDVMTTDLFTVGPDELLELATRVMQWKRIRHVPVEEGGRLVGLVSHHHLIGLNPDAPTVVRDVMTTELERVRPGLPLAEAVDRLLASEHGILLVVDDEGLLLGLVTDRDLLRATAVRSP